VSDRFRRTVGYGIDPAGFDPAAADRGRVRRELGLADGTPVVGQVAWFYPVLTPPIAPPGMEGRGIKGHEDLLAAARIVLDRRPDVRFLVVGDGFGELGERHFEDIRRLATELGLDDSVIFAGRRSDLVDVLAAMDVSVQASLSENYGGTIESLLMERPMVATDAGGMPEVVIHEQTGLLVPVLDPEALAAAILRLVEDPELGRRLGERGRARMLERHTIQHTIDGVIEVYREVAAERGLRRTPFDEPGAPAAPESIGPLGLMPADVLFTESQ
jgi:glycosyltransferase involved in cell wall biosynthesis